MSFKALLFPQTLFYPLRLLNALAFLSELWIIELINTKDRFQKYFSMLENKTKFLSLPETFKQKRDWLKILQDLHQFGLNLRTPENFKLFKLHQELFEETSPFLSFRELKEDPIDRAFLSLALAEDMDFNLLEIALSFDKFSKDWEEFFDEKILYKDNYIEVEKISLPIEESPDKLWEVEKRISHLKRLFPLLSWEKTKDLKTLLISEPEIVYDLFDELVVEDERELSQGLRFIKYKEPLNEKIGLPLDGNYPLFQQVLLCF